ncbi:uncharacterized protein LOC131433688 [Malaya genurostris]|uniref:uncharacterized protein LOC131433688 n=1 Tax=Malaya genurostris TaxID=325434 RepID=UPI0026F40066|nr:uncharacterized protein LOC131433688 [Malaya genurostris]XP_058456200.1 uncharacterized protein LOC131433688 [Malaya genurostris]XP_058456201.1 uncharacterized protein LOC131433688 [Malaya genurostris]XP_058456202.1 uncharacterized protein LOC131433688 [Malaya genurostris]
MSSESEEQDFDGTQQILRMMTALSPEVESIPTDTISNMNPFQIKPSFVETLSKSEATIKEIFGSHCECGAERVFAAPKESKCLSAKANSVGSKSLEHGIINPTTFKHKNKGEKKGIIRESILQNIGKCVHQNLKQNNVAKKIQPNSLSSISFTPTVNTLKASLSENNLTRCFNTDSSNDILDFRLLVDQCSELTISSPSGGKAVDSPNFAQGSFRALRQPDFSAFQRNRTAIHRRNRRARQLKRSNSTSSLESDSSSTGSIPFSGPKGACSTGASHNGSQQIQSPTQQQQSHSQSSSPSSSSSASCSTQARLNSTMPCDITIDEMASYFETLVHIPKKMSSMAEMMYI